MVYAGATEQFLSRDSPNNKKNEILRIFYSINPRIGDLSKKFMLASGC